MSSHSNRPPTASQAGPRGQAGALFDILWVNLTDLLGDAATAALIERGIHRATMHSEALGAVRVISERFEHRYVLPESWKFGDHGMEALRLLVRELEPLLAALSGRVVLDHLRSIPDLTRSGLLSDRESAA